MIDKKTSLIILLLLLSGCGSLYDPYTSDEALKTHSCTKEEFERVKNETLFCRNNSGYLGSYCFGTAIIRVCSIKPKYINSTGE